MRVYTVWASYLIIEQRIIHVCVDADLYIRSNHMYGSSDILV